MINSHIAISTVNRRLFCLLLLQTCVLFLISTTVSAESGQSPQAISLEALRAMVAANEDLVSLIKMDYTIEITTTGEPPRPSGSGIQCDRHRGRGFTHRDVTWAQDGIKQYCNNSFFYSPNELASNSINAIDGEVWKWARGPDLMQGKIDYIDRFPWVNNEIVFLGLRPFTGEHLLSEILVAEYSSIHDEIAIIDGREAYIVDAVKPIEPVNFGRIWIDCARGVPLRLVYYDKNPDANQARLTSRVEPLEFHQLPNGGWVPVEGTRTLNFSQGYVISSRMLVDIDSITTSKENIHDALFRIEFPEGAEIYNAILGVSYRGGKTDDIVDN